MADIAAALDQPVVGQGLHPGRLRDQLAPGRTLLIFLRHHGWLFARETVRDLRRSAERDPNYPAILFVQQGTVEEGIGLFAGLWPEARTIADPDARLSRLFGIGRGSLRQMLSPGVVACGVRAVAKGNVGGRVVGDPLLMPGLFAFEGERMIWRHDFRHAGDHPDFAAIPALIDGAIAGVVG